MFHFVYKITNKTNGHYYIGVHSTTCIEDGYTGSGTLMKRALRKYGVQNFDREIIDSLETRNDAFKKEAELVNQSLLNDPKCYNLALGGGKSYCKPIYSVKADNLTVSPKITIPYDINYEYKIDVLSSVCIKNPEVLTSFGKAFWDVITGGSILDIITNLYNDAIGNKLAKKYISLLERIPAFKYNLVIYRYAKTTLVNAIR